MGFYDTYGSGGQEKLKEQFNADYIRRDIEYARKEIEEIQRFIKKAQDQLSVIEKTDFVTQVRLERRHYKKVEYYVSSEQIPQVPGGEHHKIYPTNDSKRFGGTERKPAVTYALELQAKYGNCAIVGSGADLIKPVKGVVQI